VESDVGCLEVNAVFSGEPVEMLEKSIRTGLKRTIKVTTRARRFCACCSLEMFPGRCRKNRVGIVKARANEHIGYHFSQVFRY